MHQGILRIFTYQSNIEEKREMCVICNASQFTLDGRYSTILFFITLPTILFGIIVTPYFFNPLENILNLIFYSSLFFIFFVFLRNYFQTNKVVKSFQKDAYYFRTQLSETYSPFMHISHISQNMNQLVLSKHVRPVKDIYDLLTLVCFECGSEIEVNSSFCPNCGDSPKKELEFTYTKKPQHQSKS
jgi:RNA polymerase subunit RPABC4/transcription elongation factor Spt4